MTNKNKQSRQIGIVSHGAYVPSLRLQRSAIAAGIAWAAPGVKGLAKGERSVANWDEDSITMSVEAARDCLQGIDRSKLTGVMLASTTLPFADRSNSGIAVDALNLNEHVMTQDLSGSRRAGTSALIQALNNVQANQSSLVLSADCRETKPGSTQEMLYGHGAA
ncbi:MAG: hydroxymethylglutaryl-CoA synthase, partial [Planctomycetota bacterium]